MSRALSRRYGRSVFGNPMWLMAYTPQEKAAFKATIVAAAHDALTTGANWQVSALYKLREQGLTTRQAQELVHLAEKRARG